MTFALDPVLLADTARGVRPSATGELVWVPWQAADRCPPPRRCTPRCWCMPSRRRSWRATASPLSPPCTPTIRLLHHIALVLQATVAAEDVRGAALRRGLDRSARGPHALVLLCRRVARPARGARRVRAVQVAPHARLYPGPSGGSRSPSPRSPPWRR